MECVKRVIVEKEAELGRLPAGNPERVPLRTELAALQGRLTALQEKEVFLLKQAQGALPPDETCMSCISGWLSAIPTACAMSSAEVWRPPATCNPCPHPIQQAQGIFMVCMVVTKPCNLVCLASQRTTSR